MKKWKNDVFYDRRNIIIYLELFIERKDDIFTIIILSFFSNNYRVDFSNEMKSEL
jgi:hypothetical protein